MALPTAPLGTVAIVEEGPASPSAVSWAAVIGGALIAVASTLLLVALGSGIGLSSVSPWSPANPSATTFTLLAAVWLIIVQWLSSGLGGYLAGRLRTKWVGLHTDEVFFRDTAHGFLAWALATVLVAVFAASSISSAVGTATQAGFECCRRRGIRSHTGGCRSARKASATGSYYLFFSMLIGAFIASVAGAIGSVSATSESA